MSAIFRRIITMPCPLAHHRSLFRLNQQQIIGLQRRLVIHVTDLDRREFEPRVDRLTKIISRLGSVVEWSRFIENHERKATANIVSTDNGLRRSMKIRLMAALLISGKEVIEESTYRSLYEFIGEEIEIDNPIFIAHYIALMGKLDNPLDHAVRMRAMTEDLLSRFPNSINYPIFRHCAAGLSRTSKENCLLAIELVKKMRGNQNTLNKLILISSALRFDLQDEAISFLLIDNAEINAELMVEYFRKVGFKEEHKYSVLKFMHKKRLVFDVDRKDLVVQFLTSMGYKVSGTTIQTDSRTCVHCGSECETLTNGEINRLRVSVEEKVVRGTDVYMNTTPEENAKFIDFMGLMKKKNVHFDIIVDGLNAANTRSATFYERKSSAPVDQNSQPNRSIGSYRSVTAMQTNLISVLERCRTEFDRILVTGRQHMKEWHDVNVYLNKHKDKFTYYYFQNDSADDPFTMYAAFQSPSTYILTNDLLRQHKFRLDKDGELLERWLQYRHIRIKNDYRFIRPNSCEIKLNMSNNRRTVHVPFLVRESYYSWICATK